MVVLISIVLGVLSGALINLLADTLPYRMRPDAPRCHACHFSLRGSQVVTVWAFAVGQWRCAQCGAGLRWRRLTVEIASAALLAFVAQRFGLTVRSLLLSLLLECLLLITVIDLEHRLILYVTVGPAAAAALAYSLFGTGRAWMAALVPTLIGGAVGFGVFFGFYVLGFAYSALVARLRGQPLNEIAFGGGDVNLGGVVGLAVGWPAIVLSLFYTVLSGGVVAVLFMLVLHFRRQDWRFRPIPYGPFIVLAASVLLLFPDEIRSFYGIMQ